MTSTPSLPANAAGLPADPDTDPVRVVELLARSIARSGGRVVAVSIGGIERSWSASMPSRAATAHDADAGVAESQS